MTREAELEKAIERLATDRATTDDQRLLQRAVLSGNVVYTVGERDVVVGEDASGSIIITGDHNNLSFSLTEELFDKFKDIIFPKPQGIAPPFPDLVFVGRDEALEIVKERFGIIGESGETSQTLVVRGFPGVGKTTLVGVLARDPELIARYPDGVLWTSLEQKPSLMSIFATWGRSLGRDDFLRIPTPDEAVTQLSEILQNRKMLLIVDDVWQTEHGALFQKARGSSCGLLFTTRLPIVANELASTETEIYKLPVLEEADALKLMRILAPEAVTRYEKECRELLSEIEYLPLGIHVAARLLREELRNDWGDEKLIKDLINDIKLGAAVIEAKAPIDRIEGENIPTVTALLQKSTDMLDEHTRECFAYLGAFAPKPATFDLRAMQFVWEVDDPKPIVKKLIDYGLLEPVGNGRFQMHALLVAHARSLLN
ncbi:MAG: NB-ARC domain-containing protein [Pyrinomonadaceae bacterium]|nr:NB-ARC domain-containing protein [Pyrinomonadaceae bacterium]